MRLSLAYAKGEQKTDSAAKKRLNQIGKLGSKGSKLLFHDKSSCDNQPLYKACHYGESRLFKKFQRNIA